MTFLAGCQAIGAMSDEPTIAASTAARDPSEESTHGRVPSSAALLVIDGELSGTIFPLDRDCVSIGRDDLADIPLAFAGVSRRHCRIVSGRGGHALHDCQSKNGTWLNDRRLAEPAVLGKGDRIRVGPMSFLYLPAGDPERQLYERLERRAQRDGFTGCYNKSYFNERARVEVARAIAQAEALSLVVFDLDHFKRLNDGHGHDAGDAVLKELAQLVRRNGVRENDVFARFGGEEFVILLPGTALDAAMGIAERLRQQVARHRFEYAGVALAVTVSVGVAACKDGIASAAELFRAADAALYRAKQAGRDCVRAHTGPPPAASPND